MLVQAGAYVKDDACRALILLVVNAAQLHGYAVRAAYRALAASLDQAQASLLQVTTWCLGEYGELLVGPEAGKLLEGEPPLAVSEADVVGMLEAVVQVSWQGRDWLLNRSCCCFSMGRSGRGFSLALSPASMPPLLHPLCPPVCLPACSAPTPAPPAASTC